MAPEDLHPIINRRTELRTSEQKQVTKSLGSHPRDHPRRDFGQDQLDQLVQNQTFFFAPPHTTCRLSNMLLHQL